MILHDTQIARDIMYMQVIVTWRPTLASCFILLAIDGYSPDSLPALLYVSLIEY